ncbi:MAG: acyl-CoA dehydrogenase [Deltaproteobacteria bacterium]|nr:acyl-CoA dehydrogenase [Deltaproteobacteria bacterium]
MAQTFISMRNLKFMLYEMFDVESLIQYPFFADHSREVFDMVLETGMRMGRDILYPVFSDMDKEQPEYTGTTVRVHPVVETVMKACGDGGWIGAHTSYELGGQQIPNSIMTAFRGIFSAANYSACVYPFLTAGAAHLITSFGSQELIDTYVPNMFAGRWQGTMALTEPQAGSSLTDVSTTAYPTDQGYYKLKGQKIFISCADYDCVENVVNLMLAKIEGAPLGIKGISLFVVPKKRLNEEGGLEDNDITCTGIYHKLGYRGAPITQLSLGENDDCRGLLVGEPHKGIRYMFQMMNEARIDVGMGAAAIASAAYYAALEYTKERPQGRKITSKDPAEPQVPIVEHADVKRMLLFQKAIVEGAFSLIFQCARYTDLLTVLDDGEEKQRCELLLEILTPIAKTYPSEMGILSCSQGLQCLGGYGYCDEFPLEQYYRDVRIHPIHEGTTGIQGMDLLGRKVVMKNGRAFMFYLEEVQKTIAQAREKDQLAPYADRLAEALEKLKEITQVLTTLAIGGEIELFLADATLYLEFFGIIAIAWQWLLQAVTVHNALKSSPIEADIDFYHGKLFAFRYFFEYELPKIDGLARRLKNSGDGLTVQMKPEYFL